MLENRRAPFDLFLGVQGSARYLVLFPEAKVAGLGVHSRAAEGTWRHDMEAATSELYPVAMRREKKKKREVYSCSRTNRGEKLPIQPTKERERVPEKVGLHCHHKNNSSATVRVE